LPVQLFKEIQRSKDGRDFHERDINFGETVSKRNTPKWKKLKTGRIKI
jgi:hypothetical protein